jgi:sterol desaturase/sphingolipid hydroxylase (fatty acid hydroxylase superfamily)
MSIIKNIFDYVGVPLLVMLFIFLFIAESNHQLRERAEVRRKRIFINAIVSFPAFTLLRFLFIPVMIWLAQKNQSIQFGLNYLYQWPVWVEALFAFFLLDYTNYLWHIINHKIPLLWRFHVVHHTDLDLDVTTALRFHFGELIGSVFFRGAAVFLIGVTPAMVLIYEIFFEAATQFHHSNWRLPFKLETILNKLIVTPRMHGIHHSIIKNETDSNFSVIFSFWDRLHKTIRLNIHQSEIIIGMPAYSDSDELTIGYLLTMPFKKIRDWKTPGNQMGIRQSHPNKNELSI